MLDQTRREMLSTCLTQVFGRIEDDVVEHVIGKCRWLELAGGTTLFSQGEPSDGVYLVISGRLRALVDDDGRARAVNEIVRGETIGEIAVLTGEPRSATVVAVRDSVLAHLGTREFEELMLAYRQLTVHLARVMAQRLGRSTRPRPAAARPVTLCLLPVTGGVDAGQLGRSLLERMQRWGVTTLLTSAGVDEALGAGASQATPEDAEGYHKLTLWLDDQEFWHEYVLFVADADDTEWTRRCVRHADEVVLLARADTPVRVHPLEAKHLPEAGSPGGARQLLVLLHDASVAHPRGTPAWLERRRVDAHLHVRPALAKDLSRLARVLSGNAIGLVLAGGGARGFAQLGVYRALEEAGVQVDFVGGTSMGATMGAYMAVDLPAQTMLHEARELFRRENPTGDLNLLPLVSFFRGRKLRKAIHEARASVTGFEMDASDTWRSFHCMATNFSGASEVVLDRGDLVSCLCASVSIPVAFPPMVRGGELLTDGGSFNNFPTDVMARMGARRIIGVDLLKPSTRKYEFDEVPGPFALLVDRLLGKGRYRLPSIGAILMTTTIIYSNSRSLEARKLVDLLFNPDLRRIGLLDWKRFDEAVEIGYQHAREVLSKMTPEELAPYRDEGD